MWGVRGKKSKRDKKEKEEGIREEIEGISPKETGMKRKKK